MINNHEPQLQLFHAFVAAAAEFGASDTVKATA
jgi:hypothetical protein